MANGSTSGVARRALASLKDVIRPLWSQLIERRLVRTEEQLTQRMELLFRIQEQRIDELAKEVERLKASARPASGDQPAARTASSS